MRPKQLRFKFGGPLPEPAPYTVTREYMDYASFSSLFELSPPFRTPSRFVHEPMNRLFNVFTYDLETASGDPAPSWPPSVSMDMGEVERRVFEYAVHDELITEQAVPPVEVIVTNGDMIDRTPVEPPALTVETIRAAMEQLRGLNTLRRPDPYVAFAGRMWGWDNTEALISLDRNPPAVRESIIESWV